MLCGQGLRAVDIPHKPLRVILCLLTRQGKEHPDELAGQGYDRLFLFERVALPGGVVFVQGGKLWIGSGQRQRRAEKRRDSVRNR